MRSLIIAVAIVLLFGCRGEPVPRDYRDNPPAMTHPVTTSSDTPTAHGMPGPAPEPSSGAEGRALKPVGPPPDAPKTPGAKPSRPLPPNAVTHAEAPGQPAPVAGTTQGTAGSTAATATHP